MNDGKKKLIHKKIILPGGAGLVGQNLVIRLKEHGFQNIVVLDKHFENIKILNKLHPDIKTELVDLAELGPWEKYFKNADIVIMLQAQIGSPDLEPFTLNNIVSTKNILKLMEHYQIPNLIHISSSVVKSSANDFYTMTKTDQENLVLNSGINSVILRPTLLFGWFDRKHLGWLSRFMSKIPIFPIPNDGKFIRQPLYVIDFCNIIISCILNPPNQKIYNITGLEKIEYVEIIKKIKKSLKTKTFLINIPYCLFYILLKAWSLLDRNPPFTVDQLKALIIDEEFEVIDWPKIFKVNSTKFDEAINETFTHKKYSSVKLKF